MWHVLVRTSHADRDPLQRPVMIADGPPPPPSPPSLGPTWSHANEVMPAFGVAAVRAEAKEEEEEEGVAAEDTSTACGGVSGSASTTHRQESTLPSRQATARMLPWNVMRWATDGKGPMWSTCSSPTDCEDGMGVGETGGTRRTWLRDGKVWGQLGGNRGNDTSIRLKETKRATFTKRGQRKWGCGGRGSLTDRAARLHDGDRRRVSAAYGAHAPYNAPAVERGDRDDLPPGQVSRRCRPCFIGTRSAIGEG